MTIVTQLRYEQPPPPQRQNLIHQLSLMTLEPEERWGEWVRIATYSRIVAHRTATKLRHQRDRKLPPGRWEFRTGQANDENGLPIEGKYGVWARYLGPEGTPATS